jgi:hypothetical protein
MRKIFLIVFVMTSVMIFSSMAAADFRVKHYKNFKEAKELQLYIEGMGVGLVTANAYMFWETKQRLFCQPGQLALEKENFIRILDDEIARQELQNFEKTQEAPIQLLLMMGLIQTFPCK